MYGYMNVVLQVVYQDTDWPQAGVPSASTLRFVPTYYDSMLEQNTETGNSWGLRSYHVFLGASSHSWDLDESISENIITSCQQTGLGHYTKSLNRIRVKKLSY